MSKRNSDSDSDNDQTMTVGYGQAKPEILSMVDRAIAALHKADHAFEEDEVRELLMEHAARGVALGDQIAKFLARPRPDALVPALRGWLRRSRPDPAAVAREERAAYGAALAKLRPEEQDRVLGAKLHGHALGDPCDRCARREAYVRRRQEQVRGSPAISDPPFSASISDLLAKLRGEDIA